MCLEWSLTAAESVVWVNGSEQIRHSAAFVEPQGIAIGLEYNQTTTAPAAIWYDDLAVGTGPIGCD